MSVWLRRSVLWLLALCMLAGCGKRTVMCVDGTFTVLTNRTTIHGEGIVMTGGLIRADCLTLREELDQK